MRSPGEGAQDGPGLNLVAGLPVGSTIKRHHSVGTEHDGMGMARRDGGGFLRRGPPGEAKWRKVPWGTLLHAGPNRLESETGR